MMQNEELEERKDRAENECTEKGSDEESKTKRMMMIKNTQDGRKE